MHVSVGHRHSGGHHVGIADRLNLPQVQVKNFKLFISISEDLVNVIIIEAFIKEAVEVVEEVNDLVCSTVGGDVGEANDVAEKDGGFIEHLERKNIMIGELMNFLKKLSLFLLWDVVAGNRDVAHLRFRNLPILHLLENGGRQEGTQEFLCF